MITFDVFVIIISRESGMEPALYYNHIREKWVNEFQLGCGCTSHDEATSILNGLDVDGAHVISGKIGG